MFQTCFGRRRVRRRNGLNYLYKDIILRIYFLIFVDTKDLIIFYITMIRPVLEYASPVWHSSLTKKLRDKIESQQVRALRIIFGNFPYPQLLTLAELPPLYERREIIGKKFFNNISRSDNCLYHLIPLDVAPPLLISYVPPTPSRYPNAALNVLKTPTSLMPLPELILTFDSSILGGACIVYLYFICLILLYINPAFSCYMLE